MFSCGANLFVEHNINKGYDRRDICSTVVHPFTKHIINKGYDKRYLCSIVVHLFAEHITCSEIFSMQESFPWVIHSVVKQTSFC